jgi:hypothetical protein
MRGPTGGFRFDCPACQFACARLPVSIASTASAAALREPDRETALAPLRQRNFATVLDRIDAHGARAPGELLEVGCAPIAASGSRPCTA